MGEWLLSISVLRRPFNKRHSQNDDGIAPVLVQSDLGMCLGEFKMRWCSGYVFHVCLK